MFSVEDFFLLPINLPIESLMASAATVLMGGICLRLCVWLCARVHFVCVYKCRACEPVSAPWFTASLNPIQSKARAAMESEQRVDVRSGGEV